MFPPQIEAEADLTDNNSSVASSMANRQCLKMCVSRRGRRLSGRSRVCKIRVRSQLGEPNGAPNVSVPRRAWLNSNDRTAG